MDLLAQQPLEFDLLKINKKHESSIGSRHGTVSVPIAVIQLGKSRPIDWQSATGDLSISWRTHTPIDISPRLGLWMSHSDCHRDLLQLLNANSGLHTPRTHLNSNRDKPTCTWLEFRLSLAVERHEIITEFVVYLRGSSLLLSRRQPSLDVCAISDVRLDLMFGSSIGFLCRRCAAGSAGWMSNFRS